MTPFLVFVATSLDGFIARRDGNLDWMTGATTSTNDHGYGEFMARVDTLVMGRGTYEKVLTFPEWPYTGIRVIVLSRTLRSSDIPAHLTGQLELHPGPVPVLAEHLKSARARGVYVDGGQVIQAFLRAGLIDELTLTRIPVLIGSGLPLFGELPGDLRLQHIRTQVYQESDFVQSTYRRRESEPAAVEMQAG